MKHASALPSEEVKPIHTTRAREVSSRLSPACRLTASMLPHGGRAERFETSIWALATGLDANATFKRCPIGPNLTSG